MAGLQAPSGPFTRDPQPPGGGDETTGTASFAEDGNGQSTDSEGTTRQYLWDAASEEYVVRVDGETVGEMTCFDNSPPPGAVGYVETDNEGTVTATGTITPQQ